jgi:hypothetical protein
MVSKLFRVCALLLMFTAVLAFSIFAEEADTPAEAVAPSIEEETAAPEATEPSVTEEVAASEEAVEPSAAEEAVTQPVVEEAAAPVEPALPPAQEVVAPTEIAAPYTVAVDEYSPVSDTPGRVIVVPSSQARSIKAAMAVARMGDTVRVKNGVYRERNLLIAPGVALIAENQFRAILDGRGRGRVVTMGNSSIISGFEIKNGTIGIYSESAQAVIKRCRITHNIQSGIVCVGALPVMEDNFIVYNRGSGIQGWDVRTTSGSINHNTIAFNANHGISLGGNTAITIENNIIAFNDQFGIKPVEETVRAELINNNFFQNARMWVNMPAGNVSSDPLFVDPKRFNFNLMDGSESIGLGTDNQNLGARILH